MNLTEHFSIEEMTITQHREIDNNPPVDLVIPNLVRVAYCLEQIRGILHYPITVTSGYRCQALNDAVGGSKNSAHLEGRAADFICPKFGTPYAIASAIIQSKIEFDQLIYEYGRWIHFGISPRNVVSRMQVLSIRSKEEGYITGLKGLNE